MKKYLTLGLTLLTLAAVGCVNVRDHLTINPDGTGSVDLQVISYLPEEAEGMGEMADLGMLGAQGIASYPPMNEQQIQHLFAGEGFEIGEIKQEKTEDGGKRLSVRVTFSDANKLLDSLYAKAHDLWMGVDEQTGTFTVKARTGMSAVSGIRNADFSQARAMMGGMGPDPAELKKHLDKLHVEFRLTLPGQPTAQDAQIEGNTATWTIDRQALGNDAAVDAALDRVMTASCTAEAINFVPQSPIRLSLEPFADVTEGRRGEAPAAVDEAKIKAAIKFLPVTFTAERTFDYTGESWSGSQMAQLQAVMVLPRELEPQRWGNVEVRAAADDAGNDLLIATGNDEDSMMMRHMMMSQMRTMNYGDENNDDMARQSVTLMLKMPPRTAKAISKLQASVSLHYPGAPYVAKVKDAFTSVAQGPEAMMGAWNRDGSGEGLAHPVLAELGVKLKPTGAMGMYGSTMLMFHMESPNATIGDVAVYDADGKSWPTYMMSHDMGGPGMQMLQISVPGQPKPPLSLAILFHGGGPMVTFPIELTDLDITPNDPPALTEDGEDFGAMEMDDME